MRHSWLRLVVYFRPLLLQQGSPRNNSKLLFLRLNNWVRVARAIGVDLAPGIVVVVAFFEVFPSNLQQAKPHVPENLGVMVLSQVVAPAATLAVLGNPSTSTPVSSFIHFQNFMQNFIGDPSISVV